MMLFVATCDLNTSWMIPETDILRCEKTLHSSDWTTD